MFDTHIQTITLVDSERTSDLRGTTANKAFRDWKNYVNDLLGITDRDPVGSTYEYYVDSFEFQWAFCRFFWESHVLLPDIKTTTLENWNKNLLII